LVFWTLLIASVYAIQWQGRWWQLLLAVAITPIVSGRILHFLHSRERPGHTPAEAEAFLLDLAVTIPLVWNAALMSLTSPGISWPTL
jgi:hypothetical protein